MCNIDNVAKNIVIAVAIILFAISCEVMLEWNIGYLILAKALTNQVAMVYNTALCFAISAVGLLAILAKRRTLTMFCAVILFVFSILVLGNFIFNLPFRLEYIFHFNVTDTHYLIQRQMAPNTAVGFILIAISYIALACKKEISFSGLYIAGVASFILTNTAIFFAVGYLAHMPFYSWTPAASMSFSTAYTFIIFGIGLMFLIWHCGQAYRASIIRLIPTFVFLSAIIINSLLFEALYTQEQNNALHSGQLPHYILAYMVLFFGLLVIGLLYVCSLLLNTVAGHSQKLTTAQHKLLQAQTMAKLGNWTWYPQKKMVWCSAQTLNILGLPEEDKNIDADKFFSYIHLSQQSLLKKGLADLLAGRISDYSDTFNLTVNNREYIINFEMTKSSIENVDEVNGILQNITKIRQLEQQLYQAQKMEVIGQLTGGLAHDFNNLLMVIRGNLELMGLSLRGQINELKRIDTALKAVDRGAELTKRLLAFARRQLLQPKLVDLQAHINDMVRLLKPVLGEEIELHVVMAEEIWPVCVDAGQLENSILNLAVNSRDAINGSGNVTFEVSNITLDNSVSVGKYDVSPGDYVKFSITDNGCGISKDNLPKVFEPFFTTKQVGKGSGLGLSMVYGFVKQSKGHITIYSEQGHGTTVNLYLPRAVMKGEAVLDSHKLATNVMQNGTETILIVEDEVDLLELVIEFLSGLGYRVLSASNGVDALKIVEREPIIHLLCTDVVMPNGVTGPALAKKLQEIYPAMKVLFISGYTQNALSQNYILPEGTKVLTKPFKMHELAGTLRELLDEG
ncbi:MAG: ATP-binding protein [Gammaproteobacteria bacterium]